MKITVDIGHPAHVHYFKNLVWKMRERGHEFLIIARDRDPIFSLLNVYNLEYTNRGTGHSSLLGKILYLPKAEHLIYKMAKEFKSDIFISFGSIYAAHISRLLRKPHISFYDAELSKTFWLSYLPFTNIICTPTQFKKELGKKHLRFKGFMELSYLHPNHFNPDISVLNELGIRKEEKYVIVRFVAFRAFHDIGIHGFTMENKIATAERLSKHAKVFVSSEKELPHPLEKFKFPLAPARLHDALYYASLYFGDSGTTTTEAACLGTPAIRCDAFANSPQERANFIELEKKYRLLFNFHVKNQEKAIDKAIELIQCEGLKEEWMKRRENLLKDKIDVTAFMIWLIENYPKSFSLIKENPNYQEKFK